MGEKSILVVGEILFDVYERKGYEKLGGAPFNFAYHINKLLGNVNFISSVGKDARAERILSNLSQYKFPTSGIQCSEKFQTGIVNINLDSQGVPFYNILQEVAYDYIRINSNINDILSRELDVIYFGTLAQRGAVSRNTIREMIFRSNAKIKFCDLNLRENCFNDEIIEFSMHACNFLKINEDELQYLNKNKQYSTNKKYFIKEIAEKYDINVICLTLGNKGSLIYSYGQIFEKTLSKEDIVDSVGAGDAFSAMFVVAILLGMESKDALDLASDFALSICRIEGAIPESDSWYNAYLEKLGVK